MNNMPRFLQLNNTGINSAYIDIDSIEAIIGNLVHRGKTHIMLKSGENVLTDYSADQIYKMIQEKFGR